MEDIGYLAGYIEGDGCVTLSVFPMKNGRYRYCPSIQIITDSDEVKDRLISQFRAIEINPYVFVSSRGHIHINVQKISHINKSVNSLSSELHAKKKQLLILEKSLLSHEDRNSDSLYDLMNTMRMLNATGVRRGSYEEMNGVVPSASWVSGIVDSDGSIHLKDRVLLRVYNTDRRIIAGVKNYMDSIGVRSKIYECSNERKGRKGKYAPIEQVYLDGDDAIQAISTLSLTAKKAKVLLLREHTQSILRDDDVLHPQ